MTATICFVARPDLQTKPGGDTVQWQMYERAAAAAGFRTATWFAEQPMPPADLYHAFNVDRPLEVYPRLRRVVSQGRRFVVSSIHHPHAWVEEFRRCDPPGGALARLFYRSWLGRNVARSETVKEVVRLGMRRRAAGIADLLPSWQRRSRWLLEHAHTICLLSTEEERWLRRDYGISHARCQLIPNWVDEIDLADADAPDSVQDLSEPPVLVVGRIEARKNVVRVARLAAKLQRPIVFVGRGNPNEPSVRAFARDNAFVRWIPGVVRAQLGRLYQQASFLLNASYVEVSPLVDIEALHFGCPIVTTKRALHHELLPGETRTVDPYSEDDIAQALLWRPGSDRVARVVVPAPSAKRSLLKCYDAALGGG
jgi:glycosyltransferase involved in cell wall biosynthesis